MSAPAVSTTRRPTVDEATARLRSRQASSVPRRRIGASGAAPLSLVIAGGGVAAFETALAVHDLAGQRVAITLVAPEAERVHPPMRAVEPFIRTHPQSHTLVALARDVEGRFVRDRVATVTPERRTLSLAGGRRVGYDVLTLAPGARPRVAEPGAITFLGYQTLSAIAALREEMYSGRVRRVAFVVPEGMTWPAPLYEPAVVLARGIRAHGLRDARFWFVTPERDPLAVFGPIASQRVGSLLMRSGVTFFGSAASVISATSVRINGDRRLDVDQVVAAPVLTGPRIAGVPFDADGFMPVDDSGRIIGRSNVFAVGDGADFHIKQGSLATQQAYAAATAIAAEAGADIAPKPFRPVLQGLLVTGGPRLAMYHERTQRSEYGGGRTDEPIWYPDARIAGRYLTPYLQFDGA